MADVFTFELPRNWEERWPEIQAAARKYELVIKKRGNDVAFSGYGIEANIRVNGNSADVTIEKKPVFLSRAFIVRLVQDFLRKNT